MVQWRGSLGRRIDRQRHGWPIPLMYLSLVGLLALAGCGGNDDLGRVSGTVTLDGKPLEQAIVKFIPEGEGGSTSYGRTDASGNYSMEFSRSQVGASLGMNRVEINTGTQMADENEKIINVPEVVPARYNAQSELTFEVQPGKNTANFELESGGRIMQMRNPEG